MVKIDAAEIAFDEFHGPADGPASKGAGRTGDFGNRQD